MSGPDLTALKYRDASETFSLPAYAEPHWGPDSVGGQFMQVLLQGMNQPGETGGSGSPEGKDSISERIPKKLVGGTEGSGCGRFLHDKNFVKGGQLQGFDPAKPTKYKREENGNYQNH